MSDNLISPEIDSDLNEKKQRTVMLVDDSEIDREIYRRYLKADTTYQYTFLEAETGEDAFESYARRPDIILLDYSLPDIDGLEWLSQLQQQYPTPCPAIVLTGQGDENIAVQFIKIGAADYIIKSQMTAKKLQLAVDKALHYSQLQQTNKNLVAQLVARNDKLARSNQLYRQEISRNERLQEIIANVPVVIYAKDVDPITQQVGKFWLVNQEFQKIFALTEEKVINKTDRELFPPHIADSFAANDRLVIDSKQSLTTGERVYHANGELHTYLSLKFPLVNSEGQVTSIVGIANNMTEIKEVQTKLSKSEIKFRSTFEQAAVGMAHVSIDGRWLRVNQKLCEIVGYTKQELLLLNFEDITHPDDLARDWQYIRQLLAMEIQTCSLEKRYIHKNGAYIWIELTVSLVKKTSGKPDYFICVIEDISDRKSLEFSLQKSLKRLSNLHKIDKAILAAAKPEAIAQTAIDNIQNFLTCQRTSIVTFDWEQETATVLATQGAGSNVIGNRFQVSLETWQELIEQLENSNRSEKYVIVYASKLPSLSHIAKVLDPLKLDCFITFPLKFKNKLLGILKLWVTNPETMTAEELTTVEEITSQVAIALQQALLYKQSQSYALELEARVTQRTAQLEEINQELKAFTYSISHDLKAPLRAIQGFAVALQEDYEELLDDLGQDYTSRLVSSAQQMTQLIEDLLAYSRLSRTEIELQPIDLATVVNKVIEQLKLEIEQARAEIELAIEPQSTIVGSQTILIQIISNLLSNAIKFTSDGVHPQICIRTESITNNRIDSPENNIRLWVEDKGIGIDSEHQERIFKVFERLHGNETYPGTGIGLAIVKKGVERIKGRFGVESQPNKGSSFWIEGAKQ